MILGLHHKLAARTAQREAARDRLSDPDISANEQHSLQWTAGDLAREIESLEEAISESLRFDQLLADLLTQIEESAHQGRHRSLAITHLEQAQDRLRRELGDSTPN